MEKLFSVLSWNVEHFKLNKSGNTNNQQKVQLRKEKVSKMIRKYDPGIFALYEVEGKEVFEIMMNNFPDYHFHITEGPQVQEILVGVHKNINSFFTQRLEFKTGSSYLRPGALLSVKFKNDYYTLLFLHTKSGNDPKGFGLRDDMLKKAIRFRSKLNKKSFDKNGAKYIFMGDLNTMGMEYYEDIDIDTSIELKKNIRHAKRYYDIDLLHKTHSYTFYNGLRSKIPKSDLDHVFASKHINFKPFIDEAGNECHVLVDGWVNFKDETKQGEWINQYSDHSLLYFEVIDKV